MQTAITQSVTGCLVILILCYGYKTFNIPQGGMGDYSNPMNCIKQCLVGMVLGLLAMGIIFAGMILLGDGKVEYNKHFSLPITICWLISYIIIAIEEEMTFRGALYGYIKSKSRISYIPMLISSVGFAVGHFMNYGITFLALINLFLYGVFCSMLYERTKSLMMPIGFHFTWNFMQAMEGFEVSGFDVPHIVKVGLPSNVIISGGSFGPEGGVIVSAVMVICILLAFCLKGMERKV